MKRLVHHTNPEAKETPYLLLTELRTIDPRIELVYVGEGQWWLGCVNPNDERTRGGNSILAQMERLRNEMPQRWQSLSIQRNIMLGRLLVQGFARIEAYFGNDPSGEMVVNPGPDEYRTTILEDLRERERNFQRDGGEEIWCRKMDEMEEGPKREAQAQFNEYLKNDGRAHYRREIKNKVTFGHGGMTGGTGSSLIISAR